MKGPARAMLLLTALWTSGCLMPPSRGQLLNEAARDMNISARFGRVDLAAQHAALASRDVFLKRRTQWGKSIRILDVELVGVQLQGPETAEVRVEIAWIRQNEGTVRSTQIAQLWQDGDQDWQLERERRVGGDLGLFGEAMPILTPRKTRDQHFPTRVIR